MRISYFLLFPQNKPLSAGSVTRLKSLKRGPYFLDIDIDKQSLEKKEIELFETNIKQNLYLYDSSILIFQFDYEVGNVLSEKVLDIKTKINQEIKSRITEEYLPDSDVVEEYTTLLVDKPGRIKDFVEKNQYLLARFMRSLDQEIGRSDAEEILISRVSYSKHDLVIVDWEGAVIIDEEGDFESQLELLKIGNYQLLRYRILDKAIDKNLEDIRKSIATPKTIIGNTFVRTAIENKPSLLLDFDKVDQSLLLVGDWYSSKLYQKIIEEFYIDDWRVLVKNKLDSLEAIDATSRDTIIFSWGRILDIIQIIGWLVLLVGYFVLYYVDIKAILE